MAAKSHQLVDHFWRLQMKIIMIMHTIDIMIDHLQSAESRCAAVSLSLSLTLSRITVQLPLNVNCTKSSSKIKRFSPTQFTFLDCQRFRLLSVDRGDAPKKKIKRSNFHLSRATCCRFVKSHLKRLRFYWTQISHNSFYNAKSLDSLWPYLMLGINILSLLSDLSKIN